MHLVGSIGRSGGPRDGGEPFFTPPDKSSQTSAR